MPTVDQILSLIGQYGYLLVFFGVVLESSGHRLDVVRLLRGTRLSSPGRGAPVRGEVDPLFIELPRREILGNSYAAP